MSSDLTLLPVGGAPAAGLTDALTSAAGYALSEKADATRRATLADIRRFSTWRQAVGAIALPATLATVAAYLAALADSGLKVSTISRRAAAIAYAHKFAGFEPPINESVKAVVRGVRRKLGTAQKGKAPATAAIVAKLVKRIPDTLAGKRDKALILIGFAAALRRSELVALTVADVERAPDGIVLHISRSKTDQEGQGAQIAVPTGRKLKPVEALDAWLNAAPITQGPVFRRVMKGGLVSGEALDSQSVALIVKRWRRAARVDPTLFSGHSLRAGFVTSALADGADLFKVMDVTRHREVKTLKAYDRRALEDDDVFFPEEVGSIDIQHWHCFPSGQRRTDRPTGRPDRSRLMIFALGPASAAVSRSWLARTASPSVSRSANSSAIASTVRSPPGLYQSAIPLRAPAITKAASLGLQGLMDPSSTPRSICRRNARS